MAWILLVNRQRSGSASSWAGPDTGEDRSGDGIDPRRVDVIACPSGRPVSVSELGSEATRLLRVSSGVQVRFDAQEAVLELVRLGLVTIAPAADTVEDDGDGAPGRGGPSARGGLIAGGKGDGRASPEGEPTLHRPSGDSSAHWRLGGAAETPSEQSSTAEGPAPPSAPSPPLGPAVVVKVAPVSEAIRVVQGHWDALLWARVDAILREWE